LLSFISILIPAFPQGEVAEKDQAHLSYGNNPLHDAARDGDLVLLEKILKRVPGTFTDNRCHYFMSD
jgi:hypothetical protein